MRYQFIDEQPQQQEETGLGTLARGAARTAARVGESVAGLPGDIASGVLGLGNLGAQVLAGSEIPGVSTVQKYLPTSENIKRYGTESLTGDYLKPRSGTEETIDTLVGDVASLLTPTGIASKGAALTGRAIGKTALKAAGAGLVGKGVSEVFGPEAGALAKGVTLGLANLAGGRKALTNQMKADYDASNFAIPNNARQNAVSLRTKLGHDIKTLEKSVGPNKDTMLSVLKGTQENIDKKGNIKVKDLVNLKRNLNEWLRDEKLDRSVRGQFGKTVGDLNKEIAKYAEANPDFKVPYYRAEEIFKATEPTTALRKFAEKNLTIQKAFQNWKPLSASGYFLTKGLGLPVNLVLKGTGITAGSILGTKEAIKFGELIYKSPTARQYYLDAAKAAAIGDAASVAKNIQAFDKAAYKYEQSNPQFSQQSVQPSTRRYELLSE